MRISHVAPCAVSIGIIVGGAVLPVATVGVAAAAPVTIGCGVKGLSFSIKQGSVTLGDDVVQLRAGGVPCTTAQDVARQVALDVLHNQKVPALVDGLTVKVVNPCAGCTPDSTVTAKGKGALVTFTVRDGA